MPHSTRVRCARRARHRTIWGMADRTDMPWTGDEPLDELAALEVPADPGHPGFGTSRDQWQDHTARHNRAVWATQAKRFAAHGIRPGPATRFGSSSRDAHLRLSWDHDRPALILGWDAELWAEDRTAPTLAALEAAGPDVPGAPPAALRSGWRALVHQSAGMLCNQRHVVGLLVAPTAEAGWLAAELDSFGCDALCCTPPGRQPLPALVAYHELLGRHGATADHSWGSLQEGWYPIDATAENLRRLVHPDDLARLAAASDRGRWSPLDPPAPDRDDLELLGDLAVPERVRSERFDASLDQLDGALTLDWLSTPAPTWIGDSSAADTEKEGGDARQHRAVESNGAGDAEGGGMVLTQDLFDRWGARNVGYSAATIWVAASNCD